MRGLKSGLAIIAGTLVVAGTGIAEEKLPAWRSDYDAARKESIEKGLPVFLQIYSEGCIHCQRLDSGPLRNPAIVNLLNERYVPMRVEASKAPKLVEAMQIRLFPTMIIAGTDGNVVAFLEGYQDANGLFNHLQRASAASSNGKAKRTEDAVSPRALRARAILTEAQDAFRGEKFGLSLEFCAVLEANYNDLDEGRLAARLAAEIRTSPEKLAIACESMNDRLATMYATLGDSWLKIGDREQATACFEKAVRTAPASPAAREAQQKLSRLVNKTSLLTTEIAKPAQVEK